ncbi:MAG TPA: hypothetical protein VJT69_05410 [Pyrinomonadaceae bacterium]|nr:hypothetical protein [Pyrinomonadaceae bacterium]
MLRIYRLFFFVPAVVVLLGISTVNAQVIYDWAKGGDTPKSVPNITRRQKVRIDVININDILYSYKIEVTQTPLDTDDFAAIKNILLGAPKPAPATDVLPRCDVRENALRKALDDATKEINKDANLPTGYAASGSTTSIPLKDSIAAWVSHADAIAKTRAAYKALVDDSCTQTVDPQLLKDYLDFDTAVTRIQKIVDGPHVISTDEEIGPATHVSVKVIELFGPKTISTKTFSFDTADILTLSAGAMFSRIQDRTYEARKDPTSELNTLTVTGNSRATPSLVALLNYSLGALHMDWDKGGFALSAGPVLRVGGQSETSSFGFFTGISGHLGHRIFFTPGFHFGQFADFPVGFGNGSSVPANFGELTPVKRWTSRFGLAITFKTKSFDAFGTANKNVGGDEANSGTKSDGKGDESASTAPVIKAATAATFLNPTISPAPETANPPINNVTTRTPEPYSPPTAPPAPNSDSATPSRFVSAPPAVQPITQITSIVARSIPIAADERVAIETSAPVSDYSMYFRGGRFYLVLPRTALRAFQDGLQGQAFSDAVIEKHGADLVISFVVRPGIAARVVERPSGLDLVFAYTSPSQE